MDLTHLLKVIVCCYAAWVSELLETHAVQRQSGMLTLVKVDTSFATFLMLSWDQSLTGFLPLNPAVIMLWASTAQ